ncbi:N-methylhydantoinase A/acetone carboxylase, beta subunit [Desulfosporosinus orientis DSM 765]|uniref:N-methylhydantoinase A/acetone carboxylase, beta subunit n=1 Tax=Desulfosporosinus orientis (strain ATCC 19365 / DSM 765 / NCIMB 8382 / VKM B-1628 / Singapore I) TaxID=768706 RepID=G7W9R5_DESOD|nr:hydantoinase/oxoprolinase family protein [Desulfosporosinus orientis]AET70631.1 N-methylhydantoinase A/acetone carboxylase, beta subunit [Desulfosporosinus orientis DSM 765]
MSCILGIDTGGTFTDSVLLDFEKKTILAKAKAFTTPQDLTIGIKESVGNLGGIEPETIKMVSLSTTLATNSIVEGRGGRVGLILIGKRKPKGDLPAHRVALISGGHNLYGVPFTELDTQELSRAIEQMKGEVDTLAISGNLSIRNPAHEQEVREIIRREWDVPIVCAHELSSKLGYHARTVTACLNARLLPIIRELLGAVKSVLRDKGIMAPVMVVKGDGSLINEEAAYEKPIETILSGPAASVVGATFLTGMETVLTLDMGGTTTDIGIVKNHRWRMNEAGAIVAGWRTHINTAEISTFGIGGDSNIKIDAGSYVRGANQGKLTIGPARVWPLSVAAVRYPHLIEELKSIKGKRTVYQGQAVDCWMILKQPRHLESLRSDERAIVEVLVKEAHNILALEKRLGGSLSPLAMNSLEQAQIIGRISFTPTDVLHSLGMLKKWSTAAALEGSRILALEYGCSAERFAQYCLEQITQSLTISVLQSLVSKQGHNFSIQEDQSFNFLTNPLFKQNHPDHDFSLRIGLNYPIAAIGAPVESYLPAVGNLLNTQVTIPEHSEVANAVGAAVGKVSERVTVVIKPGFKVHAPWGCEGYMQLEDARESILVKGKARVMENARQAGLKNPEIVINHDVTSCQTDFGEVFLSEVFEITASGYPQNIF